MRDRIPSKPNRYAVYDDAHNFIRYEYHERADEPTQVGSALNKANLLPDDVATALGLTGDPQVKDGLTALQVLANTKAKIEAGSYTGTGTYGKSNPNSLASSLIPAVIFISADDYSESHRLRLTYGNTVTGCEGASASSAQLRVSGWGTSTISWYSDSSAVAQLNVSGFVYHYVIVGQKGGTP